MDHISFIVNQPADDLLEAHGLEWAISAEAGSLDLLARKIRTMIRESFAEGERPKIVLLKCRDGKMISLCA